MRQTNEQALAVSTATAHLKSAVASLTMAYSETLHSAPLRAQLQALSQSRIPADQQAAVQLLRDLSNSLNSFASALIEQEASEATRLAEHRLCVLQLSRQYPQDRVI